eukprot:scaffold146556_cov31-Prasinocladus_malaysianus.AAC.1
MEQGQKSLGSPRVDAILSGIAVKMVAGSQLQACKVAAEKLEFTAEASNNKAQEDDEADDDDEPSAAATAADEANKPASASQGQPEPSPLVETEAAAPSAGDMQQLEASLCPVERYAVRMIEMQAPRVDLK